MSQFHFPHQFGGNLTGGDGAPPWDPESVPADDDPHPLYSVDERRIFGPYQKGDGTTIYADPVRVYRRLVAALGGNVAKAIEQANNPVEEVACEATEKVVAAAVFALNLVGFDETTGHGLRDDEVIDTLNRFWAWCAAQKKTAGTSPTSPTSSPASSADGHPMPPTSDCGCS